MPKSRSFAVVWRVFLALVGLAVAAVLAGASYQAVMEARDDRRYPPPGRLVDVDGHRMHLFCQGEGSPTVVVEQGVGAGTPAAMVRVAG